jgi:hypothetical protein
MRDRYFTLEEANALLPWLEEQLARMTPVRDELATCQEQLLILFRESRGNGSASKEQEVADTQRAVNRLTQQLQERLQEVTQRGILVRDLGRGLVDFPSYREGREVHLCWLRGEPQIAYWHETDTGFAGRQPI